VIPERTIGESIRLAREERKLSLEDVSRDTRLSLAILRKIELDRFAELPGGIYTQNYIRILADYFGLDRDALLAYLLSDPEGEERGPDNGGVWREETVPVTRVRGWRPSLRFWALLALVLIVAGLGIGLWSGWRPGFLQGDAKAPAPATEAVEPAAAQEEVDAVSDDASVQEEPACESEAASAALLLRPPPLVDPDSPTPERAAREVPGELLHLEIEATGACRVRLGVDGRLQLERNFTDTGGRWTLYGEDYFILSTRSGDRLRLRLDGEDYPLPSVPDGAPLALRIASRRDPGPGS